MTITLSPYRNRAGYRRGRVHVPFAVAALAALTVAAACGSGGEPAAPQMRLSAADASPPGLVHFSGTWGRHGAALTIDSTGHGEASWRTYEWCSPATTGPCDDLRGHEIISGGHARLTINDVRGRDATAVLSDSTDPTLVGPVTLTLGDNDDLDVTGLGRFCGPAAPVGWCGA